MNANLKPEYSELGQSSQYDASYNPERLYMIPRACKRSELGINNQDLPFFGFDCWTHYEVSLLNEKGKPMVAIAEIIYDCATPYIVESKSLKLYFNSLNNNSFKSSEEVRSIVEHDLSSRIEGAVQVKIFSLKDPHLLKIESTFQGICIDDLDITCTTDEVSPHYLNLEEENVEETLCSDLLKSNCLVTNQPDWGSVQISYTGKKINREGLLKYLVSFRNHNEFHEQCIERIFIDIMHFCQPEKLSVYGRYTRRGGIEINPYRTTEKEYARSNIRLIRQ